jgi:predicted DNA-binding transcriptional regulator AlpA
MNKKSKTGHSPTTTSSAPPGPIGVNLFLNMQDYGARYGVSKRTVYRWIVHGLPHLRINSRNLRIPTVESDRWMKENYFRQREV